jgi:hypothetical protein
MQIDIFCANEIICLLQHCFHANMQLWTNQRNIITNYSMNMAMNMAMNMVIWLESNE